MYNDIFPLAGLTIFIITLWTLPWKGVALWKAAQREEKWWFIVLLVVNSLAVLEILYIFIFSKEKSNSQKYNREGEQKKFENQ